MIVVFNRVRHNTINVEIGQVVGYNYSTYIIVVIMRSNREEI